MTESKITVAEGKVVRLKKYIYRNCQACISSKIILLSGLEANMKRFSDFSGLYIVINLIYSNQYKSWPNVENRDVRNPFSSLHLRAISSS